VVLRRSFRGCQAWRVRFAAAETGPGKLITAIHPWSGFGFQPEFHNGSYVWFPGIDRFGVDWTTAIFATKLPDLRTVELR
jgi:hypothetical protein